MAWNRPNEKTVDATSSSRPAGCGKVPRLYKGLVAGAIVVLGAGLAAWLLMNGEAVSRPLQKKGRGLIKEATPATAPKAEKQKPAKPVDLEGGLRPRETVPRWTRHPAVQGRQRSRDRSDDGRKAADGVF